MERSQPSFCLLFPHPVMRSLSWSGWHPPNDVAVLVCLLPPFTSHLQACTKKMASGNGRMITTWRVLASQMASGLQTNLMRVWETASRLPSIHRITTGIHGPSETAGRHCHLCVRLILALMVSFSLDINKPSVSLVTFVQKVQVGRGGGNHGNM